MSSQALKLENTRIMALSVIQFCHILDFVIMMPMGPIFMKEFSISPAEFGVLVSVYNFCAAPSNFLAAFLSDRFDRKKFLLTAFVGFIVSTAFCGMTSSYQTLVLARGFAGAFGGVLGAIVMAVVADLVPEERRGKATGTVMAAFSIASVMGVPIGLFIATKLNWQASFWFIAFLSIITFFISIKVIPNMKDHLHGPKKQLKEQLKIFTEKRFIPSFLLILLLSFSAFLIIPFISPFVVKNLNFSETDVSYIYIIGGFFTIFSSRYVGIFSDKFGSLKVLYWVGILSSIPILIFTNLNSAPIWLVLITTTMFMTSVSGRFIPSMTMATMIPKSEERGIFMSFMISLRSLTTASAAYIVGVIVYEGSDGRLNNFEYAGFLSVFCLFLSFYFAYIVHKQLQSHSIHK